MGHGRLELESGVGVAARSTAATRLGDPRRFFGQAQARRRCVDSDGSRLAIDPGDGTVRFRWSGFAGPLGRSGSIDAEDLSLGNDVFRCRDAVGTNAGNHAATTATTTTPTTTTHGAILTHERSRFDTAFLGLDPIVLEIVTIEFRGTARGSRDHWIGQSRERSRAGRRIARPTPTTSATATFAIALDTGIGTAVARIRPTFAVFIDGRVFRHRVQRRNRRERRTRGHMGTRLFIFGFGLGRRRDSERRPGARALRGFLREFAELFFLFGRRERGLATATAAPTTLLAIGGSERHDRGARLGEDRAFIVDIDDFDLDRLADDARGVFDLDEAVADDRERGRRDR